MTAQQDARGGGGPATGGSGTPLAAGRPMLVDAHVHLLGLGDGGSGCFISPRLGASLLVRFLMRRLGLRRGSADADYLALLLRARRGSRFDRLLVFGHDAVYDRRGRIDRAKTHLYVPNDYVLRVAREHPRDFWACASINPSRADAMDELERVAEGGARAVKVHPPIQGIDPGDPAYRPFYRRLAELGLVLVIHTGHEHSAPIHGQRLGHPSGVVTALEEGATVVAAHAGTCAFHDATDFYPAFRALLDRWPNLYGDTAILGTVLRLGVLRRLAHDPVVRSRLVHGSDFPLPASNLIWRRPGIIREANLLERDAKVKEAYGLFEEAARRGAGIYGHGEEEKDGALDAPWESQVAGVAPSASG